VSDYRFLKGLNIEGMHRHQRSKLPGRRLLPRRGLRDHLTGSGLSIVAGGVTGFMITRATVFSNIDSTNWR
jgi:hypothetical protein